MILDNNVAFSKRDNAQFNQCSVRVTNKKTSSEIFKCLYQTKTAMRHATPFYIPSMLLTTWLGQFKHGVLRSFEFSCGQADCCESIFIRG